MRLAPPEPRGRARRGCLHAQVRRQREQRTRRRGTCLVRASDPAAAASLLRGQKRRSVAPPVLRVRRGLQELQPSALELVQRPFLTTASMASATSNAPPFRLASAPRAPGRSAEPGRPNAPIARGKPRPRRSRRGTERVGERSSSAATSSSRRRRRRRDARRAGPDPVRDPSPRQRQVRRCRSPASRLVNGRAHEGMAEGHSGVDREQFVGLDRAERHESGPRLSAARQRAVGHRPARRLRSRSRSGCLRQRRDSALEALLDPPRHPCPGRIPNPPASCVGLSPGATPAAPAGFPASPPRSGRGCPRRAEMGPRRRGARVHRHC